MNIKLYYAFYVFCGSKGVAEAAQRLGISQPALTAQLQQLEETVPFPLFQTRGRRKVVTRYGQDLFEALTLKFENFSEAVISVEKKHASANQALVRIAGRKELLTRILKRLPDVQLRIDLQVTTGGEAADLLQKGQIDIAIVTNPPESGEVIAKTLFSDPLCVAWPSSWKIPEGTLASRLKNLSLRPFLAYIGNDPLVEAMREDYSLAPLKVHRTLADWGVLSQLASRGHGWTLAPLSQIQDISNLESINLPGRLSAPVTLYLAMNKSDRGIGWLKDIYEQIRSTI